MVAGETHRASGSPGYGTQPLHWQRKQNRPKRWKKCLKVPKKTCQIGLILVLLSAHIERVSVSRMRDFSQRSQTDRQTKRLSHLIFSWSTEAPVFVKKGHRVIQDFSLALHMCDSINGIFDGHAGAVWHCTCEPSVTWIQGMSQTVHKHCTLGNASHGIIASVGSVHC